MEIDVLCPPFANLCDLGQSLLYLHLLTWTLGVGMYLTTNVTLTLRTLLFTKVTYIMAKNKALHCGFWVIRMHIHYILLSSFVLKMLKAFDLKKN